MEALLKREVILNKTLCRVMGVLTFVILTSLGAFVRIPLPFTPVPLTLQTFFILLCGAFLGSKLGVTAQLSYMFLGVLGLPIFTGAGSGLTCSGKALTNWWVFLGDFDGAMASGLKLSER